MINKHLSMKSENIGSNYRSGFVGIIGRPNVGKSTIMNYLVGSKITIVSPRAQTTRKRVLGVLTRDDAQVAFLDSPGFHEPEHLLGRYMLESVKAVADDADVLLVVVDARTAITPEDTRVFGWVKRMQRPAILVINKVDCIKKPRLLPLMEECAELGIFSEHVPISALKGDQMDILLKCIIEHLPIGPKLYEVEQQTDQTIDQRVSELVREQIFHATHEEVPHSIAVHIDEMITDSEPIEIRAAIYVERPSQKAIIIGRGGQMIKVIREKARRGITRVLNKKVHLELWVKVKPNWRSDMNVLRELGYIGSQ